MSDKKSSRWYDNAVLINILLVLFFPLGLAVLWNTHVIAKWWKVTATVIIALLLIRNFGSGKKDPELNALAVESRQENDNKLAEVVAGIEEAPSKEKGYVIGEKGKRYFNSVGKEVLPDLVYNIYDEQIYDAPIKTSITQHITVEGKYDESAIRKVLVDNFEKAKKRRGFNYHNPATHYQIIAYPKNDSRWVGLLNKILDQKMEVLTNNDLIKSIQEGDFLSLEKYDLNELIELISQYDLHEVEIIGKNPLHIRVSKEIFNFDLDENKVFYSKQNYVEALMVIMLHSNLDNFQLTARPIKCDFKKDENGKVVFGQGLNYLGYYGNLETSRFINREKFNQFLKRELGIKSISELAVDGYFYNHKLYIEMLYNDQGGITLDRAYNLLTKVYSASK